MAPYITAQRSDGSISWIQMTYFLACAAEVRRSRLLALEQPCESSTCHEISRIYTSVKVRDRCRHPECNFLNNVVTSDDVCRVNSFLGFVNLGEYCVQGVLEAYSCELTFLPLKQPACFLLSSHILRLSSTCSRLFADNR